MTDLECYRERKLNKVKRMAEKRRKAKLELARVDLLLCGLTPSRWESVMAWFWGVIGALTN